MKPISEMTADELISDETLGEVFDCEDEIYRARLILTLEDQAELKDCKKKFSTMLAAYRKKRKRYDIEKNMQCVTGVTDFDGYDQMRCGSWIANDNGIRTYTPFGGEVLACYHPILPIQRLINAETGKEKIKLAYRKGFTWREIIVDKGIIASSNKIVGLADYGVSVTSENAKNLVRYLSDIENSNLDRISEQISTSKLGWIKEDFMPYSNDIVFDNETRFKDAFESIREDGSPELWYDLIKKIRKGNRFEPKIYLAGSLASALVEPLNALPFIINLWGDTGKGKTVAIMLAASVWAYPGGNEYVTDPKSTITALELRMDFLNNLPMLIDDMAQLKEKFADDFSELIYMLCSGKGKDRANASLGLNKSTTWRNVILTNGEHSLVTETMQGGAINRIIDVEMEEGYIFPNGNEVVETLKKNFGFCGKEFIKVIKDLGLDSIKEIQREYTRKIISAAKSIGVEKEEKQVLPMSILLTADKIATDYIFKDDEYLDFDTCVNLLKNKGEVSENTRAYDYICSEVNININKFVPDDRGEYKSEVWGCIDGNYAVIINNVFNKMCERGNFSSRSFLSWANRQGIIQMKDGKYTKPKRIRGSLARCVFLKMQDEEENTSDDSFAKLSKEEQERLPFV